MTELAKRETSEMFGAMNRQPVTCRAGNLKWQPAHSPVHRHKKKL